MRGIRETRSYITTLITYKDQSTEVRKFFGENRTDPTERITETKTLRKRRKLVVSSGEDPSGGTGVEDLLCRQQKTESQ